VESQLLSGFELQAPKVYPTAQRGGLGSLPRVDREGTWEKGGAVHDPGSATDSRKHRRDSYSLTRLGIPTTSLCVIQQSRSLFTPEPTVLRSCPVSFKKSSSTDAKRPVQRAQTGSEPGTARKAVCFEGCVIRQSSAESPLAPLLPAGRDEGQSLTKCPAARRRAAEEQGRHAAQAAFTGTLQVARASVINMAEDVTSLICFELVASKEQLSHAGKNTLKLKCLSRASLFHQDQ